MGGLLVGLRRGCGGCVGGDGKGMWWVCFWKLGGVCGGCVSEGWEGDVVGVLVRIGKGMWCVSEDWEGELVGMLEGLGRGCGRCVNEDWEGEVVGELVGIGKGKWWVC